MGKSRLDGGWMAEECKASRSSAMLRQFDEDEVSRTAEKSTPVKEPDKSVTFMDSEAHGT